MPSGLGVYVRRVFRKKLVLVDHRRETHAIVFQLITPDQMPFPAQHNPGSLNDLGRQLYFKLDPGARLVLRLRHMIRCELKIPVSDIQTSEIIVTIRA